MGYSCVFCCLGIEDNENTLISPLTLFINTRVGLNAFVAFIHILESINCVLILFLMQGKITLL
jgi:hypothetical protein